jgi:hypothetical protein
MGGPLKARLSLFASLPRISRTAFASSPVERFFALRGELPLIAEGCWKASLSSPPQEKRSAFARGSWLRRAEQPHRCSLRRRRALTREALVSEA